MKKHAEKKVPYSQSGLSDKKEETPEVKKEVAPEVNSEDARKVKDLNSDKLVFESNAEYMKYMGL